jgi:hypothetical protein
MRLLISKMLTEYEPSKRPTNEACTLERVESSSVA